MAQTSLSFEKGSRVTGNRRTVAKAYLKKHYDQGASIRQLAAETGRSYGAVHRMLKESGTIFRGRGGVAKMSRDYREDSDNE